MGEIVPCDKMGRYRMGIKQRNPSGFKIPAMSFFRSGRAQRPLTGRMLRFSAADNGNGNISG